MSLYKEDFSEKVNKLLMFTYLAGIFFIILGISGAAINIANMLGYHDDWTVARVAFITSILVGTFL